MHSRFLLQVHSIVHDIGPYPWKKIILQSSRFEKRFLTPLRKSFQDIQVYRKPSGIMILAEGKEPRQKLFGS